MAKPKEKVYPEECCQDCGDPLNNANGPYCNGTFCAKYTAAEELVDDWTNEELAAYEKVGP